MFKTIVNGHLGRDAEVRTLTSKSKVINFSMCHTRKYTDKSTGEIKEDSQWIDCSMFRSEGKSVEVAEHLKKGTQVLVEGRVEASAYIAKETNEVIPTLKLIVNNLDLLGSGKKSSVKAPENATVRNKSAKSDAGMSPQTEGGSNHKDQPLDPQNDDLPFPREGN